MGTVHVVEPGGREALHRMSHDDDLASEVASQPRHAEGMAGRHVPRLRPLTGDVRNMRAQRVIASAGPVTIRARTGIADR